MIRICLILMLTTSTLLGGMHTGTLVETDHSQSLSFELVDGLILLEITVDGTKGKYILDSGAPSLVLHDQSHKGEVLFSTIDQDIWASPERVTLLEVGPVIDTHVLAWKMDLSFLEQKLGFQIDGLLGSDFLERRDIMIDYDHRKIHFLGTGEAEEPLSKYVSYDVFRIPFEIGHDNLPIVDLELDGQLMSMAFDTGAGISVLDQDGSMVHKDVRLNQLRVKQLQFAGKDLSSIQDPNRETITGILSPHTLNVDKLVISYTRKSIYLFYRSASVAMAH